MSNFSDATANAQRCKKGNPSLLSYTTDTAIIHLEQNVDEKNHQIVRSQRLNPERNSKAILEISHFNAHRFL